MTKNRLSAETSPYLLQHKDNPVHWFPWGNEAFDEARRTNRPILLSIGYAACHWCHVMAHESFEDQSTADLMNALFINIKVDREERPDVDKIYMDAIHTLGEQGGWPLTMFLTEDAEPFWGGTYFPKTPQYGRPSFQQVLQELSRIWTQEHGKVESNASAIKQALERHAKKESEGQLTKDTLEQAAITILRAIDFERGGLTGAPKFPQASIFGFLWQMSFSQFGNQARHAVEVTLTNICQGGIYDHLAGGFARYSVDRFWLVPHFEKMLYDNAQLVELLTDVWAFTRNELFRIRIEETIRWLIRDMMVDGAAFAASYDADSEGIEGKFYVWDKKEIESILPGDHASLFCATYDISVPGNWEGTNIPNRLKALDLLTGPQENQLAESRELLLKQRSKRIPPGWDDKVLSDWNGLAIKALARSGMVLDQDEWIKAAMSAFDDILSTMWIQDELYHARRDGRVQHYATADGYANLIAAALALYQSTANRTYLDHAAALTSAMHSCHWNATKGGYYFASHKADNLIVRPHYANDDATPNANATMLKCLTDQHLLTGNRSYLDQARQIHDAFAADVSRVLTAHAGFLTAFDHYLEPVQAVITGPPDNPKVRTLRSAVVQAAKPTALLIYAGDHKDLPATHVAKAQMAEETGPAAFICIGQTCSLPVTEPAEIRALFDNPS